MKFDWYETKNQINIQKHGLDFKDAWQLFKNPLLARQDTSMDYGEDRWVAIGIMNTRVIVVVIVFTETEPDSIRVISLRKATKNERTYYEKEIKNKLGPC